MTDDTPSPTTRTPVPDPGPEASQQGWPGATLAGERTEVEPGVVPPTGSPAGPPPPVSPPTPPVASPSRRDDRDHGRTASILVGLVFLGLGLWFFVDHTLGYELPRIRWSQLWPTVLIVIGVWVVVGSMRRGSR